MLNFATENKMVSNRLKSKSFLARSMVLFRVLCAGSNLYRNLFLCIAFSWLCSYGLLLLSISSIYIFLVMISPAILQSVVTMMFGVRASLLLQNSQLHFVGIRGEVFVNLFLVCVVLSLPTFDPKNSDNLINAKIITFSYLSFGMLLMMWFYCFQMLSILILSILAIVGLCLIPILGLKMALLSSNLAIWLYFAYWLWRSPLQRMFKFESFSNFVDYLFERFRLITLKKYLTSVRNKEQVILLGNGDGYLNQIFFSRIFSFVFTSLYVVLMQNSMMLCLWMIMVHLNTSRVQFKVIQSQMKLWLLMNGDRQAQFQLTERLQWRLYAYSLFTGSIMFAIWAVIHPEAFFQGVILISLAQIFIIAADYYPGYVSIIGSRSVILMAALKMAFMLLLVLTDLSLMWYLVMAVAIVVCGMAFRETARKKFISGNFTMRAS